MLPVYNQITCLEQLVCILQIFIEYMNMIGDISDLGYVYIDCTWVFRHWFFIIVTYCTQLFCYWLSVLWQEKNSDGVGYHLSLETWSKLMKIIKPGKSQQQVTMLFQVMDGDGDGKISMCAPDMYFICHILMLCKLCAHVFFRLFCFIMYVKE